MTPPNRFLAAFALILFSFAVPALADWEAVAPGVHYQRFNGDGMDIHVARIEIVRDELRIVASSETDRGTTVSRFAKRNNAVVAINADYFDEHMKPTGLAIGPCGPWPDTKDTARRAVAAFGPEQGEIFPEEEIMDVPEPWITAAVSGWPTVVRDCKALSDDELPGSKSFTRSRHPRTAIGFNRDRTRVYLVVADGRREGVAGLTLGELGEFMHEQLGVCFAINLDGGGSSTMWVNDRIVNRPSDGKERRVADHLAVVMADEVVDCDLPSEKLTVLKKARNAKATGRSPQSVAPRRE